MTFPLDLVRDAVTADVTRFLGHVEEHARTLAGLPLQWAAGPALESIGVQYHGIAGTTGLVGLTSLSSSARLLEEVAAVGQALVAELTFMAARTRDLGGLYLDSVGALRAMLEHELAGQPAEAGQLSARLIERIEVARGGDLRTSVAPTAPVSPRPAPAVVAVAAPPARGRDSVPAEALAEIFREEVREALAPMTALLAALAEAPTPAGAEPIERLFHTLKGAAATVGLVEVAELARSLQGRLASAAAGDEPIDDTFRADLTRDVVWWFELAGVPAVGLGGAAAEEPRALFEREAQRLVGVAERALATGEPAAAAARIFHLIKGSALVVGADAVAALAASLEHEADAGAIAAGIGRLRALIGAAPAVVADATVVATRFALTTAIDPELWEVFQQECQELLDGLDRSILGLDERGAGPARAQLQEVFRSYHTLKGSVNTIGLRPLGELVHELEDTLEVVLAGPAPAASRLLVDALLEAQRLVKRGLTQAAGGYVEIDPGRLRQRLGQVRAQALATTSSSAGDPGERAVAPASADPDSVSSAISGGGSGSSAPDSTSGDGDGRRYVRVALDRLDALMNLTGELVIGRSRLTGRSNLLRAIQRDLGLGRRRLVDTVDRFSAEHEFAHLDGRPRPTTRTARAAPAGFSALELDRYDDIHILARSLTELSTDFSELDGELMRELHNFHEDADRLGAIVSNLQGELARARMVPVDALFARLRLPIRDAADRDGKTVRVVALGEDVALDKAIADALFAPLLHLVRNAVGHGVERADQRAARGKPATGTVTLAARQEAGQIVVEVGDDGGGLDLRSLRARGVALGLIDAGVALDDPAIAELVFAAGVSTAASVDAVAGRGLGGNVVRRAVERLGGAVRVASSPAGTTFAISLPMTLAITRAVIARSGGAQYAVPLYFAERIRAAAAVEIVESAGVRRLLEGGVYLPVLSLARVLEAPPAAPSGPATYVIVRLGDVAVALEVDAVLGQEEIVVKPLGPLLEGHPLFAGVTFRGTGELALILDVASIVESTTRARPTPAAAPPAVAAAVPPTEALALAAPAPAPAVAAPIAARLRVLFIDDSVSVRKVAERTLGELGADVVVAVDGVEGLARLREGSFDVVFTDLEMPRMHGYDLLREIRYVPAHADLPVIVVSSRSGSKHQDQARALGASDYVTKPFTAEVLAAMLARWGRRG